MARYASGWIKLHRQILKNTFFDDAPTLAIWALLLMWANRKDGTELVKRQGIQVKRGQIVTSAREIARKLKLEKGLVKRRLDDMETLHMLHQQTSHHGTIISLVNYDAYQRRNDDMHHKMDHGRTTDAPPMHHPCTDSGEAREEQEYKNTSPYPSSLHLEALQVLNRAVGAVKRGMEDEEARKYIGERGWQAILERYVSLDDFGRTHIAACRKSSVTIAEGQFRDAIAASLSGQESRH